MVLWSGKIRGSGGSVGLQVYMLDVGANEKKKTLACWMSCVVVSVRVRDDDR
jgi:hypothetical protein